MKPLVSVLTPVYREPDDLIRRNYLSVAMQLTEYEYEHIFVVDEPRPSYRAEKILEFIERNNATKVIRHAKNKGLSGARNTALRNAEGRYIMLLDADDAMAPGRVQTQIDFMQKNNIWHSYGGYQEIHGDNMRPTEGVIMPPEFDFDYLRNLNNICYCGSNCFRKSIYEDIGGFDEDMKDGAEDLEYWLRVAKAGYKVALLPKVLYYLGVTNNNMTAKLIENGGFNRAYKYIKEKHSDLYT